MTSDNRKAIHTSVGEKALKANYKLKIQPWTTKCAEFDRHEALERKLPKHAIREHRHSARWIKQWTGTKKQHESQKIVGIPVSYWKVNSEARLVQQHPVKNGDGKREWSWMSWGTKSWEFDGNTSLPAISHIIQWTRIHVFVDAGGWYVRK